MVSCRAGPKSLNGFVLYIANHDSLSQFSDIKYCMRIVFETNFFSLKHIRATNPLASHMPPQISMTPPLRARHENCLLESSYYSMISSKAATPLVIAKNHILYCAVPAIENLARATCFHSPTVSRPVRLNKTFPILLFVGLLSTTNKALCCVRSVS